MENTTLINQLNELKNLIEQKEALESHKQTEWSKLFFRADVILLMTLAVLFMVYVITQVPNVPAAYVIVSTVTITGIIIFWRINGQRIC